MTYLQVWLTIAASIVTFRLMGTDVPLMEHIAGIYFSGFALLMHAVASAIRSRKPHTG